MKDKIILFIIGVLVGAVISTAVFYVYTTTNNSSKCTSQNIQMNGETPPEMPNGQPPEMNGETPPEKPTGENSDTTKKVHSKKSSGTVENS